MSDQELPAVSSDVLARILGVPPKTIYDLTKAGIIERGAGRTFEVEDIVRKYCEYLRGQVAEANAAQATE